MSSPDVVVRFQHPVLPALQDVAGYFAASEGAAWFSNDGPCATLLTERIEKEVLGTRATLTSSGTSALAVALHATTLQQGAPRRRLVAIPSFTFAAVASVVLWAGLEPVFVDVERDGWHMSPDHLAETMRIAGPQRFAAVISGTTFGIPPYRSITRAWEEVCARYGVPLIVDSAAGFGSEAEDGAPLGSQGTVETFSFHATKPFAIGEGGLVSTTDSALGERLRALVNFGFDTNRVVSGPIGTNAKMSEIQAAFGLSALDHFPENLAARRSAAHSARDELAKGGWSTQANNAKASWQFIPALAPDPEERARATERCQREGIEVRHYFKPLHRHPGLAAFSRPAGLENTEWLAERSLSLPLSQTMGSDIAIWIARTVTAQT